MSTHYDATRRRFLRTLGLGAGATLLGSVSDRLVGRALGQTTAPTKRLFLMSVYMMEPTNYVPAEFEPGARGAIAPTVPAAWPGMFDRLSAHHGQMFFADGLRNHIGTHQHRAGTSALSCVNPIDDRPERMGPAGAATIDAVVGATLNQGRPHGVVRWGLSGDGVRGGRRLGSGVFAVGREQNVSHFEHPQEMMDALFPSAEPGSDPVQAPFRPLRDRLAEDLRRLRSRLAPEERLGLERYEAAIVDFDERQAALSSISCGSPPAVPGTAADEWRTAEDYLVSMMSQTILALQCGLTNVVAATLGTSGSHNLHMIGYEEVRQRFQGTGVGFYGHGASGDNQPRAMQTRRLWHETHFRELARLIQTLRNSPEDDGSSAWDHTAIAYVSGNAKTNGGHHANKLNNWEYWPAMLLAGSRTGFATGGRYTKYRNHHRGDGEFRNLVDFYRGLAFGLGVDPGSWGAGLPQSTGRLEAMLA